MVSAVVGQDYHPDKQKSSNGFYVNRASGCDCHYCAPDGDIDARAAARQETG